ncbi:hypothetical protein [Chroococcidiopsis sp. SAG 2025]|nr:hypothetical protein [Chroococcidiopsis sp. SAG 2025]
MSTTASKKSGRASMVMYQHHLSHLEDELSEPNRRKSELLL